MNRKKKKWYRVVSIIITIYAQHSESIWNEYIYKNIRIYRKTSPTELELANDKCNQPPTCELQYTGLVMRFKANYSIHWSYTDTGCKCGKLSWQLLIKTKWHRKMLTAHYLCLTTIQNYRKRLIYIYNSTDTWRVHSVARSELRLRLLNKPQLRASSPKSPSRCGTVVTGSYSLLTLWTLTPSHACTTDLPWPHISTETDFLHSLDI